MRETRFRMRVWDLPTRLFCWLMPVLVVASHAAVDTGRFAWDLAAGQAMAVSLLFRLGWGVIGSETARFRQFLRGPSAVLRQLGRLGVREADDAVGHSPAGGWWTVLVLALLALQVGLDLLVRFPGGEAGPAAHFLTASAARSVLRWHRLVSDALLAAIGTQLVAIGLHAVLKGQNLVAPMVSGRKRLPGNFRTPRMAGMPLAAALLVLAAVFVRVATGALR